MESRELKNTLDETVQFLEQNLPQNYQNGIDLYMVAQKLYDAGQDIRQDDINTVIEKVKEVDDNIRKFDLNRDLTLNDGSNDFTNIEVVNVNRINDLHVSEQDYQMSILNRPKIIADKILENPNLSFELDKYNLSNDDLKQIKQILENKGASEMIISNVDDTMKPEYIVDREELKHPSPVYAPKYTI